MNANSERIIELFSEAMAISSPDERARFLDRACQDEPEVREEVESLLRAGEPAAAFLKQPPPGPERMGDLVTEKSGDVFGPYKLLQQIGEGGFGVVWMAEQSEPILRKVALKVIKAGMDSKQVLARFEAERQALAMMDHPNIARVFDAGATPTGRPYFAMELVKGIPITEFCDQQKLGTRQRLELFCDVCSAVNHAHQKGVIHRDLKPSNVMVTHDGDRGVAKVIDFGIAKATELKLTDKTLFTRFEQFLGTPVYMSPEQAAMGATDIDTRSDIYSLGMLLYELLAGRPAFDPKTLLSAGYDEMRRIINEDEPPKPSVTQRLTHGVPASAGAPPPRDGIANIPDDLDWIVMKALEKDRSRRYETANGLSADIQRHLANEPVIARPASTAYRFQKALRRNKLAFSAVAAIALTLIAGVIVSTWQAIEASKARNAEKDQRLAENQQRLRAERGELNARQIAYASDMRLAHQAADEDDFGLALELLERYRPRGKSEIRNSSRAERDSLPQAARRGMAEATSKSETNPESEIEEDLRGWEWRYLWRQCHPGEERFILAQHTGGATAVGMLEDGKTVFSAGRDKCVRLWDLESRRLIATLQHEEEVVGAAASPDGRWLATASSKEAEGQPVLLWDLATQKIAAPLVTPPNNLWLCAGSITFSPDSKRLAFSSLLNGGIRVWDVTDRREVTNWPATSDGSTGQIGVAFSADSRAVAYNENDFGAIVLRDIDSGSEIGRLTGHKGTVTSLASSPNGQTLASGGVDRTARLWNLADGQERAEPAISSGGITSLAFSQPDGRTLAMSVGGGGGRIIRLVEVESGNKLAELRGHLGDITGLTFTPDGKMLLSASEDGTVRVWDSAPGAKERTAHVFAPNSISLEWKSYGPALFLSPDGRHLLTVYRDRDRVQGFSVWDTLGLEEGERHPLPFDDTTIAAVAPGGKLAAFGSRSGDVMLWDAETGKPRFSARPGTDQIHRLVFSPDGRYLAAADNPKLLSEKSVTNQNTTVRVWNVSTWKVTPVFSTDGEFAVSLTFSADARTLMAGCWRGPVKLWQLDGAGGAATFAGPPEGVEGLALLPDGQTLICAAGSLRFWDVRTRQENAPNLSSRAGGFSCLALSPDGRRLATGARDGRITIWDVASHQQVATLKGHEESVRQVTFTPDGDHLVSVSKDQLRVWRAASWAEADAATGTQKLNTH